MTELKQRHTKKFDRFLEILPGLFAWGIIIAPAIGGLFIPNIIAYGIMLFIIYWFLKSFKSAFFSLLGYFKVREWEKVDWHNKWKKDKTEGKYSWNSIVHVIIIPNYNETEDKLSKSLDAFASQKQINKDNLFIFLAMEGRSEGSKDRANNLIARYKNKFGLLMATMHPEDIPGEIKGKASNEAYAAKVARRVLSYMKVPIDYVTVTSCDADARFHPLYFSALTYHFAINPKRFFRFWQSPILWYNNLQRVPFPIKMLGVIGHAIHLSDLQEPSKLIFNYSCYSLSFNLLESVGYWHTDIIPEDWHLFLQTFFAHEGKVEVESLYLPTYIDAPESKTWLGSLKNRYEQCRRHAWGATDIPYAIKESIVHKEIPILVRIMRIIKMVETHLVWSTNWFILTLGATVPLLVNPAFSRTSLGYNLPKMAETVLTICLLALFVMVVVDLMLRPKEAKPATFFSAVKELIQWVTLPIISLPLSVLPGLHAQTMLMVGKRLEYKVTEKV